MREQDIQALIEYRLNEAGEALEDAQLLLDVGRHRSGANRLYYAAFYAAVAAPLTKRLDYSKHSAVIAFFDKEFIRTGVLPKEYSRTLHRAFNERQQDDYMPFVEMDPDELRQLLEEVRNMVHGVSSHVREHT
ncbi:MAG: HEPN domain-containing protein [Sedimentisphaerales bacterium]|nr:HEPN domain-containing protein [Sedimentisphaerales bacterium]